MPGLLVTSWTTWAGLGWLFTTCPRWGVLRLHGCIWKLNQLYFDCFSSLVALLFTCGHLKPCPSSIQEWLERVLCFAIGGQPVWHGSLATVFSWHSVFCHNGPSWLPRQALCPSFLYYQLNTFPLLTSSGSSCLPFGLQPPRFPLPKMLVFVLAGSLWTYFTYMQNMALANGANYPICVRWWPCEIWHLVQQYLSVHALVLQHAGIKGHTALDTAYGGECEQWLPARTQGCHRIPR